MLAAYVVYQFYLGVFCIANHPVSKVCVMGDVVLIDRKHNFIGYGGTFTYWNKEKFVLEKFTMLMLIAKILEYSGFI